MEKAKRTSGIELLRILASIGVVILHFNNWSIGGGFKYVLEGGINQKYLYLSESFTIAGVDLFIMISGYYLSQTQKRDLFKVVDLLFQVYYVKALLLIFEILFQGASFSSKDIFYWFLPNNYYVVLYCVLFIISPYINLVLQNLGKRQYRRFLLILLIIFSCWSFGVDLFEAFVGKSINGLSPVGMYGSQYGYSIVNFILCYIVGAYLSKWNLAALFSKRKLALSMFGCIGIIWVLSLFEHGCNNSGGRINAWNYNNPVVIVLSASLILFFVQLRIKSVVINELAGAGFICFLINSRLLSHCPIEKIVGKSLFSMAICQIGIGLFVISYLLYKVYSFSIKRILLFIKPLTDKVEVLGED